MAEFVFRILSGIRTGTVACFNLATTAFHDWSKTYAPVCRMPQILSDTMIPIENGLLNVPFEVAGCIYWFARS